MSRNPKKLHLWKPLPNLGVPLPNDFSSQQLLITFIALWGQTCRSCHFHEVFLSLASFTGFLGSVCRLPAGDVSAWWKWLHSSNNIIVSLYHCIYCFSVAKIKHQDQNQLRERRGSITKAEREVTASTASRKQRVELQVEIDFASQSLSFRCPSSNKTAPHKKSH